MNKQRVSPDELRKIPFLRVPDCSTVSGLSQGYIRGLIRDGILPVVKHGRCIMVDQQLLLDTVRQQMQSNGGEDGC